MPKVSAAIAALTVVFALTLTGCAGAPDNTGHERTDPQASESADPGSTPEPLVAETPSGEGADADAKFLDYVRDSLPATTSIPNATDEQLIAAGHQACDDMRNGTAPQDVRVVEGEQPNDSGYYMDSSAIMNGSLLAFCPELL